MTDAPSPPQTAPPTAATPGAGSPRAFAWAGLGATIALIALVFAARLAWQVWASPYDLVEDEAQYWDWSRRFELSYYTKGPGVAWTIRAATALFGDAEWAVRLPSALSSALGALAVGLLASDVARDRRAGFFAAAVFCLVPILQGIAQFMTIDGPYLACWAWAAWFGWRAISRGSGPAWAACAAAIGVGFLFKYTILLLPIGVALAALLHPRLAHTPPQATPDPTARPAVFAPRRPRHWALAAAAIFVLTISPVIVWNTLRGWPTLGHLLKHLDPPGADAAAATTTPTAYSPLWTLEFLGQQAAMGPALGMMAAAAILALRSRRREPELWPGRRYLLLCAAPILLFYLAVTFRTRGQGNWTLAGYSTLIALAGGFFVAEITRQRAMVAAWLAEPPERRRRAGLFRRKPETVFQVSWHWTLAVGLVCALVMPRADLLARLPLLGGLIPVNRLIGAEERAAELQRIRQRASSAAGLPPLLMATYYGVAAQCAYYLPDRPPVSCARHMLGAEPSAYDFFADTDLRNPALRGRDAVMIGGVESALWAPFFDSVEPAGTLDPADRVLLDAGKPPIKDGKFRVFIGRGYRGWPVGADTPHARAQTP